MLTSVKTLTCAFALALLTTLPAALFAPSPATAQISIGISVNIAPPALPVYVQPALPAPGYIWSPGYWAWDPDIGDYYWVPGAWVAPPRVGLLWTPGYWGWSDGVYIFHGGYWGPTIGFYGGVNYGFGYTGSGYYGGEWRGNQFFYNRTVSNVTNVNVTNVYNRTVVVNNNAPRTSFNGGPNGVQAQPTAAQLAAAKAPHVPPTPAQAQHANVARTDPQARFKTNQGKPAQAAVVKPLGGAPPPGAGGAAKPLGLVKKPAAGAPLEKAHDLPKPGGAPPLNAGRPRTEHVAPERPVVEHPKPQPERLERVERPKPQPERVERVERPKPQPERVERPHPQPVAPRVERAPPPVHAAPPPPRPAPPRPAPPHPAPCHGPQCPK